MRILALISTLLLSGCSASLKSATTPSPPPRSGQADVGGTKMSYEVSGRGQPVLLLHAGIEDSRMWDDQVGPLTARFTVVRCDLRGFSRTPRDTGRFSHHRDVAALLDSLEIGRVHVVGASFGGRVAIDLDLDLALALAPPERVRSLALLAPAVSGMAPTPELELLDSTEESLLAKGDLAGAAAFIVRTWVVGPSRQPGEVSAALQRRVAEMQQHNFSIPHDTGADYVPLDPRAFTRLEEVRAPTLVLIGDNDVPSFQSLSEVVARRIPNANRIVVPDAAHMLGMERPKRVNRILMEHLSGN